MPRSTILLLVAWVLASVAVAPGTASGFQGPDAGDGTEAAPAASTSYEDAQLAAGLRAADLMDAWIEASPVSAQASLIDVAGSSKYLSQRSMFIDSLRHIAEQAPVVVDHRDRIDALQTQSSDFNEHLAALRDAIVDPELSAAAPLSRLQSELDQSAVSGADEAVWSRLSLSPVALAELRFAGWRTETAGYARDIDLNEMTNGKAANTAASQLSDLASELAEVRTLVDAARKQTNGAEFELVSERAEAIAAIDAMHSARMQSPSSVDGLPLVTVDTYIVGASLLDPECPVPWNLLAGVGRVESFHGTIGGSRVQASGAVSTKILGPLLDGGATAREAEQNAAEAALEAERQVERLAAEERAAAEELAAEAAAFNAMVWGDDAERRAEDIEAAEAPAEPVGLAADPVTTPDVEPPRYDPALWGDDLEFSEEELAAVDAVEEGEVIDDEDALPEFKGNGFAVIVDTDNGRLDGNARWDRAVGPMQFIPETWSYWGTDGNSDGSADPQNLYDAAASAGRFLCYLSRTRGTSPYNFVLGYNSSSAYVSDVMDFADAYGSKALPTV